MADETPVNPVEHPEHAPGESSMASAGPHVEGPVRQTLHQTGLQAEAPSFATAALVGVGVALIEPELIPGMLIGAGAWLAPKLLPAVGSMLRPMVMGVVKAGYSATATVREAVAEAGEQFEDMVAEARAEHEAGHVEPMAEHQTPAPEPQKRQRRQPRTAPAPAANL